MILTITHKLNSTFATVSGCIYKKEFPYVANAFGKEKGLYKSYIIKVQKELRVN
jgi:hypothetical protein